MRKTGLIPARVLSYKKYELPTFSVQDKLVSTKIRTLPVWDQGACEGCYAWAISDCLSYNYDVEVSVIDILQAYDDAFMGCMGGHVSGLAFENYMSDIGVSVGSPDSCDPSCFNPDEANSLQHTVDVCEARNDLVHQTCTQSFYFSSCCWPKRPGLVGKGNWESVNDARVVQAKFQTGSIHAAVMTIAVDKGFFLHPSETSIENPALTGWVPLHTTVQMGDIGARHVYVPTKHSLGGELYYHAVVVVGWTWLTEKDVPGAPGLYWWAKNSWSDRWGDQGMFLVAASENIPTNRQFVKNNGIVGGNAGGMDMVVSYPISFAVGHAGDREYGSSTTQLAADKRGLLVQWTLIVVATIVLISIFISNSRA